MVDCLRSASLLKQVGSTERGFLRRERIGMGQGVPRTRRKKKTILPTPTLLVHTSPFAFALFAGINTRRREKTGRKQSSNKGGGSIYIRLWQYFVWM